MAAVDVPAVARGTVRIEIDGAPVQVPAGLSVAAALTGLGTSAFAIDIGGAPRGVFCGMGACHDCLVTVNGRLGQRACMTTVRDGMTIARPRPRPDLSDPTLADICDVPAALPRRHMDVLVIGAGPGGLAAAEAAAAAGASVTVVDERTSPGGQYYKQPATVLAAARVGRDAQAAAGRDLIGRVIERGVALLAGTLVWGGAREEGGLSIGCYGADGAFYCRPRMLIIATGAFERPRPIPGWTLPGVMTTGAAQGLLRSYGTVPGRRMIVAGNGPLNLQVASEILAAGGDVAAVVDVAPAPWTRPAEMLAMLAADAGSSLRGLRLVAALRQAGVPMLWASEIEAVEGGDHAIGVRIRGASGVSRLAADTVLLGGGFTPANELSRLLGCRHVVAGGGLKALTAEDGATSLADVHVIGEAARFAGAQVALAEGRLAGQAVAAKLGLRAGADSGAAARLARAKRFQTALWRAFAPARGGEAPIAPETVVCRCEGVTAGRLAELIGSGARDIATLKRLSRAGMGRCQSRYCAGTVAGMIGEDGGGGETAGFLAPQMPLRPIPLAALAVEKPEWGGHRRAWLPPTSPRADVEPLAATKAATVVIGAGICGLATALFLARGGEDVVVVDRAQPNALASGGNAGSLHAQLLSFDHGARAEAGGGPAVRTLPLQRDSIALWAELQRDFGVDFEMKITGGLMVGETPAHLRFLEAKAAAERSVGIDCEVIDRTMLRRIEPALSDRFIGAAFCPQEGKINPLLATQAVLRAAWAAGAQVFSGAEVRAIEQVVEGFRVATSRGSITARRVVNAAGAFASRIGAMLGVDVPVFGAPLQMVVTEAAAPLISCLVAHADRHLTLKQAANGNFIIGGGWTAGLDPVHQHPRPLLSSLEGNLWVAQHVVPALRKLHVIRSWAAMNINIDGAPILGEHPDRRGFFTVATSNGYTLGPLVGLLTARLVRGRDPGRDLAPFAISRFVKDR